MISTNPEFVTDVEFIYIFFYLKHVEESISNYVSQVQTPMHMIFGEPDYTA